MTDLDVNDDWQALLRTILVYPHDTLPRLVAADWLDENATETNGFAARAEFIRLSCEYPADADPCDDDVAERLIRLRYGHPEWFAGLETRWTEEGMSGAGAGPVGLIRRGFVDELRCPLAWWAGVPCLVYRGGGLTGGLSPAPGCGACGGGGRTGGHGAEVVARHPVTKVVMTDMDPGREGSFWLWYRFGERPGCTIPDDVFRRCFPNVSRRVTGVSFRSRGAAEAALSRALVDLAREGAGLPPLPPEVPV